jgi:signal transduction histidine kinase
MAYDLALQSPNFLPHVFCYQWNDKLVLLHSISDGLIFLAYSTIPFGLVHLVRKRKDIPFNWVFLSFGCFIVFCGLTHLMEIWTLWHPDYWLSGMVKALTAVASITTAIALIPIIPKAIAIPSPAELKNANETLREREESLRGLTSRLLTVRDEERRRLARELHDSMVQELVGMKMLLEAGAQPGAAASEVVKNVQRALLSCDTAIQEVRSLSHLLHPPLLDEIGLGSALRWYVDGLNERSAIVATLEMTGPEDGRLNSETETAIFRIIQECLTNVLRHSGSPTARIRVARSAHEVIIEVKDEGKGVPNKTQLSFMAGTVTGVGLAGMRERVRQLGGTMEIQSAGRGTLVSARLPLGAASTQIDPV